LVHRIYAETNRYRFAITTTTVLSSAVGHITIIIARSLIVWILILQSSSRVSKSQTARPTDRGRADAADRSDVVRIRSGFPLGYYVGITLTTTIIYRKPFSYDQKAMSFEHKTVIIIDEHHIWWGGVFRDVIQVLIVRYRALEDDFETWTEC